jgi:predicted aspartyl protease
MRRLVLAFVLSLPFPAAASCRVGHVADAPFEFIDGYVFVPVSMNGTQGSFLLDTGASQSMADSTFAARAGIGFDARAGRFIWGGAGNRSTLPGYLGHVRITQIGDLRFQDWEYGILDLGWMVRGNSRVDGILGVDFLRYFDAAIDVPRRIFSIYRVTGCDGIAPPDWKGDYDAIPLKHTPDHNLTLPVFVDNTFLTIELDTGAGHNVLLTRDAAAKAGVDQAALALDVDNQGNGVGGTFHVAHHRFGQFLVGSNVYDHPVLAVENERRAGWETDGLMGLGPLQAQRLWISFSTNTLFVQRANQAK